jgi:hypothetical protein
MSLAKTKASDRPSLAMPPDGNVGISGPIGSGKKLCLSGDLKEQIDLIWPVAPASVAR